LSILTRLAHFVDVQVGWRQNVRYGVDVVVVFNIWGLRRGGGGGGGLLRRRLH